MDANKFFIQQNGDYCRWKLIILHTLFFIALWYSHIQEGVSKFCIFEVELNLIQFIIEVALTYATTTYESSSTNKSVIEDGNMLPLTLKMREMKTIYVFLNKRIFHHIPQVIFFSLHTFQYWKIHHMPLNFFVIQHLPLITKDRQLF